MARVIKKGLAGLDDFSLGISTFSRTTSVGGSINLTQVPFTNVAGVAGLQLPGPAMFGTKPWYDVTYYGADPTGVASSTTAVQNAINAASVTGGIVFFPQGSYLCNVTMKPGVTLLGCNWFAVAPTSPSTASLPPSRLLDASSGTSPVITISASGNQLGYGIANLYVRGTGSGSTDRGLYITGNADRSFIMNVTFDNFGEQGLYNPDATSNPIFIQNVFAQNCLLNAGTRASRTGAIHLTGSDIIAIGIEAQAGGGSIVNASLYNCGIYIAGSNGSYFKCIGELSEAGIAIDGGAANNEFVACRSDLNLGHGFLLGNTSDNRFLGCFGNDNSQGTTNTYDDFSVSSSASGNQFVACNANNNLTNVSRYGYNDARNNGDSSWNSYLDCKGTGQGTGLMTTAATGGAAVFFPSNFQFLASGLTPSVSRIGALQLAYASPATITNFLNGVSGQTIRLLPTNGNITLKNNATIVTKSGSDTNISANQVITLSLYNGVWYQHA